MRIAKAGFFRKWSSMSRDEKLQSDEFNDMYEQIKNNKLSFYKGSDSEEFLFDIAAANAISRGHVQRIEILILRTSQGCIMIADAPGSGTTGVKKIDAVHVHGGGLTRKEDLLDIFDSIDRDDVFAPTKDDIYDAILRLEKEQPDLPSRYRFTDRTLNKLAKKRSKMVE